MMPSLPHILNSPLAARILPLTARTTRAFTQPAAFLLMLGKKFVKHSGVRGAIHQDLVKSGALDVKWGRAFDHLFENRQAGDYLVLYEFEKAQVAEMLEQAEGFVGEIKKLLGKQA